MSTETKTGQSIDTVKENLLSPILVDKILQLPTLKDVRQLSVVDVGTGDASYSRHVINQLVQQGVCVDNLGLIDADTEIFSDLLTTTLEPEMPPPINVQVVETKKRAVVGEFLRQFGGQYDVAISQLVLHQILNDSEMSHLMYTTYQALKPEGTLFLVDLHPRFIRYLMQHEPTKFSGLDKEGVLEGEYHFDSGGSVTLKSREVPHVLGIMLGLGFDFVDAAPILPEAISDEKERYRQMVESQTPMFYVMQLRKNEGNFVSSTEGVVRQVQPYQENGMLIAFTDGEEIIVPKFPGLEDIMPNDHLTLLEIHRPENDTRVINYWATSESQQQEIKEIKWNQVVFQAPQE